MKKLFILLFFSALFLGANAQDTWSTEGNEGIDPQTNFLGSIDPDPLIFRTANIERMRLTEDGKLGIGSIFAPLAPFHLQVANPPQGKLLQIGAGADGVDGNLVLKSDPEKKNMALEYLTNGVFSIDGIKGGIRFYPAGTVEVYQNILNSPGIIPDAFKVFGDASFNSTVNMLSLNAQSASIAETLTAHILNGQSANVSGNTYVGGNLGVGTNQPTQKLHVVGTSYFNGNLGVGINNPTQKLHVVGNTYFDGQVGILTDTPAASLHVHTVHNMPDPIVPLDDTTALRMQTKLMQLSTSKKGTGNKLEFGIYSNNSNEIIFKQDTETNFHLQGSSSSGLTIAPNGNVGIGTIDTQAKLNVSGSFKAQSANITGTLTANTLSLQNATIAGTLTANILNAQSANIAGTITAQNANIAGNVGIGTTNPQSKLQIHEGTSTLSFGRADYENLGYGTSYIGFNAVRNNGSNGNWTLSGDGYHNGGSVLWTTVEGDIYFAPIATTGGNTWTRTDNQVKDNVKLHLTRSGVLKAKEILVTLTGWPDYVFEKEYKLLPLPELEQYIKQHQRLPEVPSANEVESDGVNIGNMQSKLLLKIEELTLYIIEQEKQMQDLQKRLSEIENMKVEK